MDSTAAAADFLPGVVLGMFMRGGRRFRRWWPLALLVLLTGAPSPTSAQTANAPMVTAALLFNFAKFTEWPLEALSPGAPLALCVVEAPAVATALEQVTAGRDVRGHAILVRRISPEGPLRSCQVLYLAGLDRRRAGDLIGAARGVPVLSVSDFPVFTRLGGVAHLFLEDSRMRFAVNLDAANRAQLRVSSQLLSLAVIVRDDPNEILP
jgi:hypothetical protein